MDNKKLPQITFPNLHGTIQQNFFENPLRNRSIINRWTLFVKFQVDKTDFVCDINSTGSLFIQTGTNTTAHSTLTRSNEKKHMTLCIPKSAKLLTYRLRLELTWGLRPVCYHCFPSTTYLYSKDFRIFYFIHNNILTLIRRHYSLILNKRKKCKINL